jgi:hypothetical protein
MENINQVLLDVRKSYRLLYEYQRKMLDIVKFVKGKYRLDYEGGYPKFSKSAPGEGRGNLENWAWDWLSMYFYEFHFYPQKHGDNLTHFSIFLLNDTGYFLTKKEKDIHRKTLSAFADVEKSESKLILIAGHNQWDAWNADWLDIEFTLSPSGVKREADKSLLFKQYNVADFANEAGAVFCLKDFSAFCAESGCTLKYFEKQID